jgi:hypothetical protein
MVVYAHNPSYLGSGGKSIKDGGQPGQKLESPKWKANYNSKRTKGDMTQVVQYLPSKHEALNLIPSTTQK